MKESMLVSRAGMLAQSWQFPFAMFVGPLPRVA
jgi:hypothetical protein